PDSVYTASKGNLDLGSFTRLAIAGGQFWPNASQLDEIRVAGSYLDVAPGTPAAQTAPVLDASASPTLGTQGQNAGPPVGAVGTLVSSLVDFAGGGGLDNVTDADAGALLGVAVTGVDTANGSGWFSLDDGATWTALGAPDPAHARLLAADAVTRVYFQSSPAFTGTLGSALTFRAWDRTSGGVGAIANTTAAGGGTAYSTATDTVSLTVVAVNDAPAGSDKTVAATEDTPYVLGVADFGFSDAADTPPNALAAVHLSTLPATGALTLNGAAVTTGQAVAAADISAGKLVYTPAANANGSGAASFTFQVQDDGGTANGGVDLDPTPNTLTIDLAAVNDAPVLATAGGTLAYTEGQAATAIDTGLTLSDVDSLDLSGATVRIAANYSAGQDVLGFTDQLGISGSWDAGTGVLTLSGTASVANYQTALRAVTYVNTAGPPVAGTRTVSFAVSDGAAPSNAVTHDISVAALSQVQLLAVQDTTVNSGSTSNHGTTGTLVVDRSGGNLGNGRVLLQFDLSTIPAGSKVTGATLLLQATANATPFMIDVYQLNEAWAEGSGGASAANWIDRLPGTPWTDFDGASGSSVGVTPAATWATLPPAGAGQHSWNLSALVQAWHAGTTPNFGILLGSTATGTTTVTYDSREGTTPPRLVVSYAPNVAPVVTTTGSPLAYTENGAAAPIDPGLTVADADDTQLSGATVGIVSNYVAGQDLLAFTDQLGISGSWDAGTGVLTLSGTASVADYQTALRSVSYANSSDNPSALSRTVKFVVDDGMDPSLPATTAVNVTAVNDAPLASNLNAAEAYTEDTPLALKPIVVTDVDSADVSATLTLSAPAAGALSTGTSGSVTASYDAGTGVWSASGALADVNALLASLTFTPSADYAGNFSIATQISDGAAAPLTGSKAMTGSAVNDAPAGTDRTITTLEDTPRVFSTADFGFTDPADSPANALAAVRLGTLPSSGALTLNGVAVSAGQFVSAADIVAGKLVYTPAANANGSGVASFTFQVQDNGGTANSGVDLDPTPNTITLNVSAVNDAPTINAPATVGVIEDQPSALTGFFFGDIDAGAASVVVDLGASAGSLSASSGGGVTVSGSGTASLRLLGSVADINSFIAASAVRFTTPADAVADVTLTVAIDDDGNTGVDPGLSGTASTEAASVSVTLKVTAVNDAPAGTDRTITTPEDTPYVFSAADFGFTDPADSPANALAAVRLGTL
ncbi:MAG: DNRLRE domain-containing protein, partial [Rubrivivax sp.]|nr:DNRLRE domain-containing protein [Rubrivivax sp.]